MIIANSRYDLNVEAMAIDRFQRFPVKAYLANCHRKGRAYIPEIERKKASRLYIDVSTWLQANEPISKETSNTLHLAKAFLWGENFLYTNPAPKYEAYSSLRVLNWYLCPSQHEAVSDTFSRCRKAISLFVTDWLEFEKDARSQYEIDKYDGENFYLKEVTERIKLLAALKSVTHVAGDLPSVPSVTDRADDKYPADWLYYGVGGDGSYALLHLTGLPQSKFHDEYMFLRTIHIAECCFLGAIVGIKYAAQQYSNRNTEQTLYGLREAAAFCRILVKLFLVFPTMPKSSFFDGFREDTGDASAIQSRRYQELELLVRGFSNNKGNSLSQKTETKDITKLSIDKKFTLAGISASAKRRKNQQEVQNAVERIQKTLLMWRAKHLGIAKKYLPEDATGTGEEGVPYLEENLRNPMPSSTPLKKPEQPLSGPNKSVAAFNVSLAFEISASECAFELQVFKELNFGELEKVLAGKRSGIEKYHKDNSEEIGKRIGDYTAFFSKRAAQNPLQRQFRSGLPSKSMPIMPKALLTMELRTGLLMGIHDMSRITGELTMDVAARGEFYDHISGSVVSCSNGDWVIRDGKSIIASYFSGPDKRTSVVPRGDNRNCEVGVFIFGYPGMDKKAFEDGSGFVSELLSSCSKNNDIYRWSGEQ